MMMNKVCSSKTHDGQIEEMKRDRCTSGVDERAEAGTAKSPRGFPKLLHKLLCDMERSRGDHIISWCPGGTCFKVHDHRAFEARIMPHYFAKNTSFSSFLRQLSLYEFRRCGGKKNPNGPKGAYKHPFFIRDKPGYLSQGLVLRVKNRADGRKSAWNLISQHEQHPEKDPCVSGLGGSLSNSAGGEPSRHISSTTASPLSSTGARGHHWLAPRTQGSLARYVSNISGSSDMAATPTRPESGYSMRMQQRFSYLQPDDMNGYLHGVVVEPLPTPSSTVSSLAGVAPTPPVVDNDILHEILKTFGRKTSASGSALRVVSSRQLFDDTPLDAVSSNPSTEYDPHEIAPMFF